MTDDAHLTPLPNSDTHTCFACSPVNPHGLGMTFARGAGRVIGRVTIAEHLCGWKQVAHGGIVATVLDEVMAWAAMVLLKQVALTRTMTVEYARVVPAGRPLTASARVTGGDGRRRADLAADLTDADGHLLARARGDYSLMAANVALRLGIVDEPYVRSFIEPLLAV